MKKQFSPMQLTAYEAISEAQKIAYAPLVFQAVRTMRELGILEELERAGSQGTSAETIAGKLQLSVYGVETLLESGLSCGVLEMSDDDSFVLTKVGYFLLRDRMTRINMDYNHHICYLGMYYLEESIRTGRPEGLRVFGEKWQTLYQALPHLPETIKNSWYAFDHFYSDSAYPDALPIVFKEQPKTLLDIGTNVGKFSILAAQYDQNVRIAMVDLPEQLENATRNVEEVGLSNRIESLGLDLLDENSRFPAGVDVFWLSQVLSCFSKPEIISILKRVAEIMDEDATVYVLETCWDRQQHEAAAYSLINTSLYFTAIASGDSKMYHSKELMECFDAAGLSLAEIHDNLGICHSLFECKKFG